MKIKIGDRFGDYTVIDSNPIRTKWDYLFLCRCKCGTINKIKLTKVKQCKRCYLSEKLNRCLRPIGTKIGSWIIIDEKYKYLGEKSRGKVLLHAKCECGFESYIDIKLAKKCKKCTAENRRQRYEDLPLPYLNSIKESAKKRNLNYSLTPEYVWNIFIVQNKKCALTKIDLDFGHGAVWREFKMTASLDRIDSSKGYILGNVQWLYKPVNFMKQDLSQDEFIKLCGLIYNNNK